jgi:hypothetical protein
MENKKVFFLLFVFVNFVSGCVFCPRVDPKYKLIMDLDDRMIPLAKAVDIVVDELPPEAKDQEILLAAVKRSGNPDLLKPFEGYVLRARMDNGVAVLLLCSPDGKEGIIEDVTCTTRPDTHRPTGSPCTYLLDVKRVCAAP